jgi:hypothetical protein
MRPTPLFRWLGALGLALALPLSAAACNQADQDKAEQKADQARDSAQQIGGALDQLGEDAKQKVQQAADQLRDGSREVREAAARNGVSTVAAGEFRRHGIELEGTPNCAATSEAIGQYQVDCTAPTKDGRTAKLVGGDPGEAPSNFVGTVDGLEIFRQECVGLC